MIQFAKKSPYKVCSFEESQKGKLRMLFSGDPASLRFGPQGDSWKNALNLFKTYTTKLLGKRGK